MGTMHAMNTDPVPQAGTDTVRRLDSAAADADPQRDVRRDPSIDDPDEAPEENGYGHGV